MWRFLTRIFRKHTKICDQCHSIINPKRDPAICLRGADDTGSPFEQWICEPCAEKAWLESLNDELFAEIEIAEEG